MAQALEKAYNKPAKAQGSIIGFTRRKEAVAQFSLTRHEKAKISSFLRSIYHLQIQDECTLKMISTFFKASSSKLRTKVADRHTTSFQRL